MLELVCSSVVNGEQESRKTMKSKVSSHNSGPMTAKELKSAIRSSHQKQFNGIDYQQAAYDSLPARFLLASSPDRVTDEELREIESSPDPCCECGFCKTAEWQD